jgi:hypothetical protein
LFGLQQKKILSQKLKNNLTFQLEKKNERRWRLPFGFFPVYISQKNVGCVNINASFCFAFLFHYHRVNKKIIIKQIKKHAIFYVKKKTSRASYLRVVFQ